MALIKLTFETLSDFITECVHRGLARVFVVTERGHSTSGCADYTAYDADDGLGVWLSANVEYPEVTELQRLTDPGYNPSENYRSRDVWSASGGLLGYRTNSKAELVTLLKSIGGDPDAIKALNMAKVTDLSELIDMSNATDETEVAFRTKWKKGRVSHTVAVTGPHGNGLLGGLVKEVELRVEKESSCMIYTARIADWPKIRDQIRAMNEAPLREAGLKVLHGKIEVTGEK